MKPSAALPGHRDAILRIVSEHHARNPRVYGSVLRGTDQEDSDLDLLVDDLPETSLMDLARIERRLSELLGVTVEVKTPLELPDTFRVQVLAQARPL